MLDNVFAHETEQAVIQNRNCSGSILASRGKICAVLRKKWDPYIHADFSRLFNINKKKDLRKNKDILISQLG